jgi:hypothetical protein
MAEAADRDLQLQVTFHGICTSNTILEISFKGTQLSINPTFTNTGNAPLVIVDAKSSCGCEYQNLLKNQLPGAWELLVKFNGGSKTKSKSKKR